MSKKQDDNILEELSNANVEKVYERDTASYDSNKNLSIDNDDKAKELEKADSLSSEASESENIISDYKSSEEIEEDMTIKLDKNFNDFEEKNAQLSKDTDSDFISEKENNHSYDYSKDDKPIDENEEDIDEEPKRGILFKIFSFIGNLIFIIFVVSMIFVIFLNTFFYQGVEPSIFGHRMFVVGESSMSPNLDINDAVLVKDSSITDIKEGDLIFYRAKNGKDAITSWVIKKDGNEVEVSKKLDDKEPIKIDSSAIIGVSDIRVRNVGPIVDFISHPIGILLVLVIGFVIYFIASYAANRNRY